MNPMNLANLFKGADDLPALQKLLMKLQGGAGDAAGAIGGAAKGAKNFGKNAALYGTIGGIGAADKAVDLAKAHPYLTAGAGAAGAGGLAAALSEDEEKSKLQEILEALGLG